MPLSELAFFHPKASGRRAYARRVRSLFEQQLEKNGLRLTRQRGQILDVLLGAKRHLSQEEMHRSLKGKGVGKVTIFRMLKLLEESGLVDRVTPMGGAPRFELKSERPHHDHLICLDCGGITEVRWPEVERIQEKTCRQLRFLIVYHRHEIFGRCRTCQEKPARL